MVTRRVEALSIMVVMAIVLCQAIGILCPSLLPGLQAPAQTEIRPLHHGETHGAHVMEEGGGMCQESVTSAKESMGDGTAGGLATRDEPVPDDRSALPLYTRLCTFRI
jgi:hypothetical protein